MLAISPAKAVKEFVYPCVCDKLVDDQKKNGRVWNVHVWLVNVYGLNCTKKH